MRTTSTTSTLSVLFVLLAACGDGPAPSADPPRSPRASVVAPAAAAAPTRAEAARGLGAVVPAATPALAGTPAAGSPPAAPASGLRVVAATFTHGVEARRPVDEARSFAVGERATLHLVVENLGAPRDLTVEWFRGETVLGRTTLAVGTSPAWRTWAARRVTIRDAEAGVSARVLDADGTVLQVEQAAVASSAPAA